MPIQGNQTKPRVGVIYSDSRTGNSNESKNLAHYICALLSSTGYALVNMIAMQPEGQETTAADLRLNSGRRIHYLPTGNKGRPLEVPVSSFSTPCDELLTDFF